MTSRTPPKVGSPPKPGLHRAKKSARYKAMWKISCDSVIHSTDVDKTNLSVELLEDLRDDKPVDLEKWEPELCIGMIRLAIVKVDCYMALRKLIQRATSDSP
ncbi:hypothetical protein M8J76_003454 [Diaphorina citri]|nr:hypothetical protein M8J75_011686 [Diaphorina citri]KAI5729521.1 hypothetical protein M8J76_003454 [Diaphorina citri]